jgi:glycosyltransferase involved in cell wall biosynthesis
MKILFLSRWYPYPPDNGSKIRIFNLIKYLSQDHVVDLIAFTDEDFAEEQIGLARKSCRFVWTTPFREFSPTQIRAILGFLSPLPRSTMYSYSKVFENLVTEAGKKTVYDLVIASQIDTAPYAGFIPDAPKILEELEVTTRLDQVKSGYNALKLLRKKLGWWKFARYINSQLQVFNACTVVSEKEKEHLLRISPGYKNIGIVPNGIEVDDYHDSYDSPNPDTLIYSGALDYYANFDAMNFFLRDIFPLIVKERPGIKLLITGRKDISKIKQLPSYHNVVFTGYINDIHSAIYSSWCSIVPLRIGGGTRLKILEAMALGSPVVSTTKGAEGLNVQNGHDILIADEPLAFAQAVLRLLRSPSLRERLGCNGQQTVKRYYKWSTISHDFEKFINRIVNI